MTEENLNTENEIEDPIEDVVAEVADDSYTDEVLPGSEYGDVTPPAPVVDGPAQAVGRRKEAIVRVRLVPGSGNFTFNGRTLEDYFPNKVHQQIVKSPLVNVEREEQFDIIALLRGGGPSGQAGATRLAIARALTVYSPDDRPSLKKAGYLTRDDRAVERKKAGLKKARKAPQYSKR